MDAIPHTIGCCCITCMTKKQVPILVTRVRRTKTTVQTVDALEMIASGLWIVHFTVRFTSKRHPQEPKNSWMTVDMWNKYALRDIEERKAR